MSLRRKIGLSIVVAGVGAALLTSLLFTLHWQALMKRVAIGELFTLSEYKEGQVFLQVQALKMRTADFASDGEIRASLQAHRDGALLPTRVSEHIFRNKLGLSRDIYGVSVWGQDGVEEIIAVGTRSTTLKSPSRARGFSSYVGRQGDRDNERESMVWLHEVVSTDGAVILHFVVPIFEENEEPRLLGFLSVLFSQASLQDVLSGVRMEELGARTQEESELLKSAVSLYLSDGAALHHAHGNPDVFVHGVNHPAVEACLRNGEEIAGVWAGASEEKAVGSSMCIDLDEERMTLVIEAPLSRFRGVVFKRALSVGAITGTLAIALALLISHLFASVIREPLDRIMQGVRTLSSGNLNHRIGLQEGSELGVLAQAFDRMAEDLDKVTVSREELVAEVEQRKVTEATLAQAQALLFQVIDTTPYAIAWKDRDRRYLGANREYAQFVGVADPNSLVNKTDDEVMREDRALRTVNLESAALAAGAKIDQEEIWEMDGDSRWHRVSRIPLLASSGQSFGMLIVAINIDAQIQREKRFEQQRRIIEQLEKAALEQQSSLTNILHLLLDGLNADEIGVWRRSKDTHQYDLVEVASKSGEISNFSLSIDCDLCGGGCMDQLQHGQTVLGKQSNQRSEPCIGRDLDSEADTKAMYSRVQMLGDATGVLVVKRDTPIDDWTVEEQQFTRIAALEIGRFFDGIEREQVRRNLEQAMDSAHKAALAKTDFLSSMSHELRTPLNAVIGFGSLIKMEATKQNHEDEKTLADEVVTAGRYLLRLIDDILDYSRIESGNLVLKPQSVQVERAAKEAYKIVEASFEEREIQYVWEGTSSAFVMVDPHRLNQILINLLSNAMKYNRNGGKVFIDVTPGPLDRQVISVRDTGHGIPEQKLEEVFEPFVRLETSKKGIDGVGIGLVIVRRLVEQMGGKIWVESEEGVGSTFFVELPRGEVGFVTPPRSSAAVSVIENGGEEDRSICYIEDNPINARLMQWVVRSMSESVKLTLFETGEEALQHLFSHRYHLVIVDISLPEMDGFQVLEALRNAGPNSDTTIIALSANATSADIESGLRAGFDGYFTKPIDPKKFQRSIADVLWPVDEHTILEA